MTITLDIQSLYDPDHRQVTAKLADMRLYIEKARAEAGEGNEVILTGQGPIWLYLKISHALHGKCKRLVYRSPVLKDQQGKQIDIVVFDHDAL
jgi:hypothetical protein